MTFGTDLLSLYKIHIIAPLIFIYMLLYFKKNLEIIYNNTVKYFNYHNNILYAYYQPRSWILAALSSFVSVPFSQDHWKHLQLTELGLLLITHRENILLG